MGGACQCHTRAWLVIRPQSPSFTHYALSQCSNEASIMLLSGHNMPGRGVVVFLY